jgi:hypothetical protein
MVNAITLFIGSNIVFLRVASVARRIFAGTTHVEPGRVCIPFAGKCGFDNLLL